MNNKNLRLILVLIFATAGLLWLRSHKTHQPPIQAVASSVHPIAQPANPSLPPSTHAAAPTTSPQNLSPAAAKAMKEQEREREKKLWDSWLATPISFYGKVIDERGNPVPGASALISFVDTLEGTHTKANASADANGLFHASGHGLGVVVMVSMNGYYRDQKSDGDFRYANTGEPTELHSDPNNPAVFVLRKIGKTEPLIIKGVGGSLAKNGKPTEINMQSGQKVGTGQGDLKIECWTKDQGAGPNDHFDWTCRISPNGGGITERTHEFDFEAPNDGYRQTVEIDMPKTLGDKWCSSITKDYFIQLANGTFARVHFMMNAGGEQTFALTSFLNPTAGSRNLEYDPAQQPNRN